MTEADHWLWRNLPFSCSYSLLSSSFVKVRFILSLSQPTKYITIPLYFQSQLLSTSLIKLNSLCNGSRLFQLWRQWGNEKYQVQYGSEDFEIWLDLNTMWLCSSVHRRFQRALQNRLWMSISFVTVMKFVLIPHFHVEGILSVHWSWIIFFLFCFWFKI